MKKLISVILILATVFALMVPAFADHATGFNPHPTGFNPPENEHPTGFNPPQKEHSTGFGINMWVNCPDGYGLNVREEPALNGRSITQLDCGTRVTVLTDCGNGWVYISSGNVSGYVMRKFLQKTQPGKYEITERADHFVAVTPYFACAKALNGQTATSVGLRVRPNKTSQAIRRLTAGDELEVIARGQVWSQVVDTVTGKTGYVANDYLTAL